MFYFYSQTLGGMNKIKELLARLCVAQWMTIDKIIYIFRNTCRSRFNFNADNITSGTSVSGRRWWIWFGWRLHDTWITFHNEWWGQNRIMNSDYVISVLLERCACGKRNLTERQRVGCDVGTYHIRMITYYKLCDFKCIKSFLVHIMIQNYIKE